MILAANGIGTPRLLLLNAFVPNFRTGSPTAPASWVAASCFHPLARVTGRFDTPVRATGA